MKKLTAGLVAAVLILGVAVAFSQLVATAQVSEQEAMQIFQQIGCVSCHNGAVAPDWNGTLEMMQKVQTDYGGDIDAFARDVNYFGRKGAFNSWNDLMATMAQNVGKTLDDPDIQKLNEFFLAYAGVQAGGGQQAEQPAETQTQTQQEQPQEQQPAEAPAQEQPAQEQPAEEGKGIPFALAVAIAVVITLVVVGAAYFFTRK